MGRQTTVEERTMIVALATAGHTDRQIATALGWRRATVRKWRRRGQQQGRPGLAPLQGRPATGTLSTFPPLLRETLRAWRQAHPGWGAKTLRAELARAPEFAGWPLPSRTAIACFLAAQGLPRPYQRHSVLPQPPLPPLHAPHEVWGLDAKGQQRVPGVGMVALLNLHDWFSHLPLLSYPCWLGETTAQRHPTTEDYQLVLRLAFTDWGLPDRLAVDHDSIFYDNTSKSPFPTRLHLWLVALGVTMHFGRPGRPTDQAMTERSHQLWTQQVVVGQTFDGLEALARALRARRDFLLWHLPCAALGEVPPLVAHPEALCPRRPYRPEWEADLLDLTRVERSLSQGRWFRRASNVGVVALGGASYSLGPAWAREEVELTFDAERRQLVCVSADGTRTQRRPIKGLTPAALMGELGALVGLEAHQLALPFSWDERRVLRLCETLGVTT